MAEQGERNLGGAPVGNRNALNAHRAKRALIKALARSADGDADEALAKIWIAAINKAYDGSEPHAKLIIERIDGKPVQAIEHSGPGGGSISTITAEQLAGMSDKQLDAIIAMGVKLGIDPFTDEAPE